MLEQEGLAPIHIVAHSFGARVAVMLAAKYPELVQKMVITGGGRLSGKPQSGRRAQANGAVQAL